jgi:trimeric autotransporter adhesin
MVCKSVSPKHLLAHTFKPILAFALLCSALLSTNAMAAQNLFINPSFSQSLAGWNTNVVNPQEDSIRWVNDGGDGMTSAARFYTDGKENPAWHMQLAQSKTVVAGALYKLSFDVATTSQYEREVALYMQEDGGKWAIITEQLCTIAGEGITRCELLGTIPSNGKVNFGIKGADNLWDFTVDNAELNRLDNRRIDSLHFPDPSLAAVVAEKQATYVYEITELNCANPYWDNCRIKDMSGIEELTALKSLAVSIAEFPAIDLSRMTELETLVIESSRLQTLDLSHNKSLINLSVNAPVSILAVNNNPNLISLDLSDSGVSELDLSNNPKLESISLGFMDCDNLLAIQQQFPNMESLTHVRCFLPEQKKPLVAELPFNDFYLRACVQEAGVDYVEDLRTLRCAYEARDYGRGTNIRDFTGLGQLNALSVLDLDAYYDIDQIDFSKNTKLTTLVLSHMGLSSLDLSANAEFKHIVFLGGFYGEELDLSNNHNLHSIWMRGGSMERLILPEQSNFESLFFLQTNISSIDLSKQPNLIDLTIMETQITSLDLSKNVKLRELSLVGERYRANTITPFANLDLSNNSELNSLGLSFIEVSTLNLSGNPKLTKLGLGNNNLQSINLSNNKALTNVSITDNPCLTIRSARHQLDPSINFIVEQKCSPQNIPVADIHFPDAVLQDCFNKSVIAGQWKTLADVQALNCDRPKHTAIEPPKINSAAGMEQLTELRTLNLNGHSLDHIDLKSNVLLTSLSLRGNELSELNLSSLVNLTELDLRDNPLTLETIEAIERLPALSWFEHPPLVRDIYFPDSLLAKCVRDTGKAMVHELTELRCYRDVRDTTGIEHLTALIVLALQNAYFNTINLQSNMALKTLVLNSEQLTDIRLNNSLENLSITRGQLQELRLDDFPNLKNVELSYVVVSRVSLYPHKSLESLTLYGNPLDLFDESSLKIQKNIRIIDSSLRDIDLSVLSSIEYLLINTWELPQLDLSANLALRHLYLYAYETPMGDNLKELDLSANKALTTLELSSSTLVSLNIAENTLLTNLDLRELPLSSIDLRPYPMLESLSLYGNSFSNIDLSSNPQITSLNLESTSLSELDLSGNRALRNLLLRDNKHLTSLDLSNNSLERLSIDYSQFTCAAIDMFRSQLPEFGFHFDGNCSPQNIPVVDIHFPDAVLQDCFNKSVIAGQWKTLADVQSLNCERPSNTGIAPPKINSAEGIEQLTELRTLNLNGHSLDHIDLKSNVLLTSLSLRGNKFSELDLSSLVNLTGLDLRDNPLTLDTIEAIKWLPALSQFEYSPLVRDIHFPDPVLAQCVRDTGKAMVHELTELRCYRDVQDTRGIEHLTALTDLGVLLIGPGQINLTSNAALKELYLQGGQLAALDLSFNKSLERLAIIETQLSELDLSENLNLKDLQLSSVPLDRVNISAGQTIEKLSLARVPLNLFNDSDLQELKSLGLFYHSNLTDLDLFAFPKLEELTISDSPLVHLNLAANPLLKSLYLIIVPLSSIDLSNNHALISVALEDVPLKQVNLAQNPALSFFGISGGALTELDLSANKALTSLHLGLSSLVSLNISENTLLTSLSFYEVPLSSIDLQPYAALENLGIYGTPLSNIDISSNPQLTSLSLQSTSLSELDLSGNRALRNLSLRDNIQLTTLDLSNNSLEYLSIYSSQFTCADIEMLKSQVRPLFGFNYDGLCVGAPSN